MMNKGRFPQHKIPEKKSRFPQQAIVNPSAPELGDSQEPSAKVPTQEEIIARAEFVKQKIGECDSSELEKVYEKIVENFFSASNMRGGKISLPIEDSDIINQRLHEYANHMSNTTWKKLKVGTLDAYGLLKDIEKKLLNEPENCFRKYIDQRRDPKSFKGL